MASFDDDEEGAVEDDDSPKAELEKHAQTRVRVG